MPAALDEEVIEKADEIWATYSVPCYLETGAEISSPLFINEGDVIRVNTETGEYVERV